MSEALQLLSSMLRVVGKNFDDRNFFESNVKNTARYTDEKSVQVMGREFQQKGTTRITGKVFFRDVTLKLDKLGYERKICKVKGEGENIKVFDYDQIGV